MTKPRVRRFQRELRKPGAPVITTDAPIPGTLARGLNIEALQTQAWWNQAFNDGFIFGATSSHTFNATTPAVNANATTQLGRMRTAGMAGPGGYTFAYARPVECFVGGINGLVAADLNNLRAFVLDVEAESDTTHPPTAAMVNMLSQSGIDPMIYTIAGDWNTITSSSVAFSGTNLWDRYNIPGLVPSNMLEAYYYYYFGGWNTAGTKRKIWQIWDPYTEQGVSVGLDYADRNWLGYNATRQAWKGWSFVKAPTDSNTVNDYTRAVGKEGDGAAVGTSYGFWNAATNRCTNGGATTNVTGWTNISGTISRITTDAKFFQVGSTKACFQFVKSNAATNEGASTPISGGAASTQYTVSFWAKLTSGAATVAACLNDNVSGNQNGTPVVLDGTWQKVSVTATTGAGSGTWLGKFQSTVQAAGTYLVDGFQIETGPIATPYVETDGGTATRNSSLLTLTVGSTAMTPTQGWVALRVRPRWGTAAEPYGGSAFPRLLTWRTDNNNGIFARYNESGNTVSLIRVNASVSQTASQAYAPASGTSATIILAWDSTNVGVSVNGAAFTNVGVPQIPTISNTFMDIMSLNASENFDGECLWAAWGATKPSDGDASTINSIGDTPPTPASFPSGDAVNGIWAGFFAFANLRDSAA